MQYVACMQLSQLENASLMSDNCPCASSTTPLGASPACTLRANMSTTPPLTLLAIARSIEGILASTQPKLSSECPNARIRSEERCTSGPRCNCAAFKKRRSCCSTFKTPLLGVSQAVRWFLTLVVRCFYSQRKLPECSPQFQPNAVGSIKRSDDQRLGRSANYSFVTNDNGDARGR